MHHSTIEAAAPALAQFDVDARELFEALAWLKKAAWQSRNYAPILAMVHIEASPSGFVTVECTDLDRTGTVTLAATVSSPGAVLVDRTTLADFAKRAEKGRELSLIDQGGRAKLKAGRATASVPTLPAAEWPTMARKVGDNPLALNMAADAFAADLARLSPAICKEETRYYLRGVNFDVCNGALRLVATDGHRLSLIDRGQAVDCRDMSAIVPDCAIQGIVPMLRGAESLSLAIHGLWGEAIAGAKRLAFKLIDGTFPDWRRVVPSLPADCPALHVAGAELAAHCATAAKGLKHRALRIEAGPAGVMAGQTSPAPHARPLSAIFDGPPIAFAFDAPVIEPFAKLSERLIISGGTMIDGGGFTEPSSAPMLVLDPDAPHWTGVAMTMRTDDALPRPRAVEYADLPAAPGQAADLFGVEPINRDRKLTGRGADKPRKATADECEAYLLDYARRCGLPMISGVRLIGSGDVPHGLVIGETRAPAYEIEPIYADGAYCVPMPGRNQAPVTVQTLDDDGQWSDPMPCQDDKGKIALPDAAKGRRTRKAAPSAPKAAPEPVIATSAPETDPIEALAARLDAVEVAIERPRIRMKAIAVRIDGPPSVKNGAGAPAATETEIAPDLSTNVVPWPGARARLAERDQAAADLAARERAKRARIVRAYLNLRAERAALKAAAADQTQLTAYYQNMANQALRARDSGKVKRRRSVIAARALQRQVRPLEAYRANAAAQYDRTAAERDAAKRMLADVRDKLAASERDRAGQANAISALASRVDRVEAIGQRMAA